jgi:serine acetyltransferase
MAAILYYWECIIMSELPTDFIGLQNKIDGLVKNYLDSHPDFIEIAKAKDRAIQNKSNADAKAELAYYPGVVAVAVHEEANKLYNSGESIKKIQARQLSESAHSRTGIDIHPGTKIGDNLFIDHGTGVVIGETAKVGKNTLMYHGVTLGAYGETDASHRHPEVGDNCTISTGVEVLGHVVIGNNVSISPNALICGNNIQIGNNAEIKKSAKIEDNNEIAAGVKIGARAVIEKNTGLIDRDIEADSYVAKGKDGKLHITSISKVEHDIEKLSREMGVHAGKVAQDGRSKRQDTVLR